MMLRATTAMLTLIFLAACGRKGARRSDFDSATSAALATGGTSTPGAEAPKVARVAGFDIGHGLDRHDMIFGGPSPRFGPTDSVLISVRAQYAAPGTDVSARIRLKNTTVDSVGAKAGAADSTGMAYVGLRFGPAKAWARGTYQADVFINGKFQVSQDFVVVQ